ncbi:helix-turn-helix domain-containing protein [Entomospira culicis]|uniref:Helix-turn-helix transcriptional regulator n=1 Tax=Entomospira culicis TaxID=2719989 RepID=A0A968GF89_9SPIO|nr:helix-turn-helix transcriptional regulator [Entomospira culicis]NIZ19245.1 helix-turn-helix transcriptional regulator [Entomospira culicis]NIZ69459.1 helix-turn-helix transcriptional regulator [Entomospira culicis]WDI36575.1 helix-turn-helix transcriptional regulator [Entomospira culicis]WDI38201.1 helix-turn-helix transcriptional regulator [Entomospira culicis]
MQTIGQRVRLARKHFGWTQHQAAEHLGVKQNMLSRYEREEHHIPDPIKVKLHALGINLTWLLTGEGEMLLPPPAHTPLQDVQQIRRELLSLQLTLEKTQADQQAMQIMLQRMKNIIFK